MEGIRLRALTPTVRRLFHCAAVRVDDARHTGQVRKKRVNQTDKLVAPRVDSGRGGYCAGRGGSRGFVTGVWGRTFTGDQVQQYAVHSAPSISARAFSIMTINSRLARTALNILGGCGIAFGFGYVIPAIYATPVC